MNSITNTYQTSAIGSDDFKDLIESGQYIDKSLFIKDVLTDAFKVPLITRPRRWGKSSNMSMLKTFLEIEVDEHGNELTEEHKRNPVYFKGGEICVDNKTILHQELRIVKSTIKIQDKEYDVIDYLGRYPVIMANFKDLGAGCYENLLAGLKGRIRKIFTEHKYLLNSAHLSVIEKDLFTAYLYKNISEEEVKNSLNFLMECLFIHFGKKVWVLIDEYDSAIHKAYVKSSKDKANPHNFSPEFDNVLDLFRDLMGSALKSETHLERGVITGILRIAQANLFSGLSNVKEYSVLSKRFASYYGFEQHEVDALCERYQIPEHKQKKLAAWYNGYNYGGLKLYNPWSIMNFMTDEDNDLKNYWEATSYGALQNLEINKRVYKELQDLLSKKKESLRITVGDGFNLNVLLDGNTSAMRELLLLTGYFNPVEKYGAELYAVNIPNQEVRIALGKLTQKWLANEMGIDKDNFNTIAATLEGGDVEEFYESLSEFLETTVSFYIMKEKKEAIKLKESHYHFLMIGLLNSMMARYDVTHEIESGDGCVDTMIIPRALFCKSGQAIVLEYKYAESKGALQEEAENGLAQIEAKNYTAIIKKSKHVKSILQLGIAFHNKEVAVVHKIVQIN